MSGQVALRISSEQPPSDDKRVLVERCYEDFAVAHRIAVAALGNGRSTLNDARDEALFGDSIRRAVAAASRLRECLDYEAAPVLAAYLNTVFDHVITRLLGGRAAREVSSLVEAGVVMEELQRAFLAVHRRADR
jgi:flagellin-specific chaperone FliS